MARDSSGSKNQPVYAGTGAPATAADLTELGAYAALVGNTKALTNSQRIALTGADLWIGLVVQCTDTNVDWQYTTDGWRIIWQDTDWISLGTYNTGWTTESGDTPEYRVISGVVYFRGRLDATAAASQNPFANPLPTAVRPSRNTPMVLGVTSGATPSQFIIQIGADGVIIVYKSGNTVNDLALAGITPIPLL